MRNEFLLWNNASRGLPRTGLVALYDPYCDVYGRNVSITTTAGMYKENVTESSGTFLETSATGTHALYIEGVGVTIGSPYAMSVKITPVGRRRLMLGQGSTTAWALFDTTSVSVIAQGAGCASASIVASGDGTYTLTAQMASSAPIVYSMPDAATDNTSRSFAGDTSKGFTLHQWQVNLGSQLFPYSAPAGAPGTLQTSLDYSGNGNHLTLGATTNASTDDPAFTGTAWSFDGGDFLLSALKPALTGGLTVLSVTKIETSSAWDTFVATGGSGSNKGFYLAQDTITPTFKVNDGSASAVANSVSAHANGAWAITCGQVDVTASKIRLYTKALVKVETALGSVNLANALSTDAVRLGWNPTTAGGDPLGSGGLLAFAALWTRCLPEQEVYRTYRYIKSLMAPRGIAL